MNTGHDIATFGTAADDAREALRDLALHAGIVVLLTLGALFYVGVVLPLYVGYRVRCWWTGARAVPAW